MHTNAHRRIRSQTYAGAHPQTHTDTPERWGGYNVVMKLLANVNLQNGKKKQILARWRIIGLSRPNPPRAEGTERPVCSDTHRFSKPIRTLAESGRKRRCSSGTRSEWDCGTRCRTLLHLVSNTCGWWVAKKRFVVYLERMLNFYRTTIFFFLVVLWKRRWTQWVPSIILQRASISQHCWCESIDERGKGADCCRRKRPQNMRSVFTILLLSQFS